MVAGFESTRRKASAYTCLPLFPCQVAKTVRGFTLLRDAFAWATLQTCPCAFEVRWRCRADEKNTAGLSVPVNQQTCCSRELLDGAGNPRSGAWHSRSSSVSCSRLGPARAVSRLPH